MAKGAYIGINSQAAKIKKIYVGIDGIAQKVKRAYIGVNGVAQLWWTGGELKYAGTATSLSVARYSLNATHVGNYALFGAGYNSANNTSARSALDVYDVSLTRTALTSTTERLSAATHVGDYALFGGGAIGGATSRTVAYDISLTETIPTPLSTARYSLAATHVGDYALFGGGLKVDSYDDNGDPIPSNSNVVDAYNVSLTRTTPDRLEAYGDGIVATHVGDYALFVGGTSSGNYTTAYNTSLTKIIPSSSSGGYLTSAHVGNYALFVNNACDICVYNASLTRTIVTPLSTARYSLAATHVGDYALFGGGCGRDVSVTYDTVDAYDASLVRTIPTPLSASRRNLAATHVGNYALFAGGLSITATVDVYTID